MGLLLPDGGDREPTGIYALAYAAAAAAGSLRGCPDAVTSRIEPPLICVRGEFKAPEGGELDVEPLLGVRALIVRSTPIAGGVEISRAPSLARCSPGDAPAGQRLDDGDDPAVPTLGDAERERSSVPLRTVLLALTLGFGGGTDAAMLPCGKFSSMAPRLFVRCTGPESCR